MLQVSGNVVFLEVHEKFVVLIRPIYRGAPAQSLQHNATRIRSCCRSSNRARWPFACSLSNNNDSNNDAEYNRNNMRVLCGSAAKYLGR